MRQSGRFYTLVKRTFDIVLSLALSIALAPLSLLILLLILLRDPGNPFYVHRRVGQNGRELKVLKFRTMRKSVSVS